MPLVDVITHFLLQKDMVIKNMGSALRYCIPQSIGNYDINTYYNSFIEHNSSEYVQKYEY